MTTLPSTSPPTVEDGAATATAARRLAEAARTRLPCRPVRDVLPPTLEAAYAVQQVLTRASLAQGRRISGRKVGLTNPAVQVQLGVDQPDFGVLFDDMAVPDAGAVDAGRLISPRVETEVAMVLGADLTRPPFTAAGVRAAVAHVVAALEIVDSRIADWDITLVDTVADNASCGLYVLGSGPVPLGDLDLSAVAMTMREEAAGPGEHSRVVSTGSGRDCLGDPLEALAWLAATAAQLGDPLRAGDVVLSGALGPMVPALAGATYTASVTGLGTVSVSFDPHDDERRTA